MLKLIEFEENQTCHLIESRILTLCRLKVFTIGGSMFGLYIIFILMFIVFIFNVWTCLIICIICIFIYRLAVYVGEFWSGG